MKKNKTIIFLILSFLCTNVLKVVSEESSLNRILNYKWEAKLWEGIEKSSQNEYKVIFDFYRDWSVKISKFRGDKKIEDIVMNYKIYEEEIYLYGFNYDLPYGKFFMDGNKIRLDVNASTETYENFKVKERKDERETINLIKNNGGFVLRDMPKKDSKIVYKEEIGGSYFIILEKGNEYVIDNGREGHWLRVITDKKVIGWILKYKILVFSKVDSLRLREAATIDGKIIRNLVKGEKLELLEKGKEETVNGVKGNWVKVKTEKGEIGWCFDGYLEEVR